MTLAKLCEEYQVELCLFDGSNWHSSGFYNPDPTEFDYLKFMSYYNLKTMTNEIMVKEEYLSLVN